MDNGRAPDELGFDLEAELARLKDFQRDAVEYVFRRLYLDKKPARRFLVADEVGLGKTLVARGVVARAIQHLCTERESGKRFNVVYICSNAAIARQNIARLKPGGLAAHALPSRVTLLPLETPELERHRLSFISFTPGTSFDQKSSLGVVRERALLHVLLHRLWGIGGEGFYAVMQGYAYQGFGADLERMKWAQIDETLVDRFGSTLEAHIEENRQRGESDIRERFTRLCRQFGRGAGDSYERSHLVGELRTLLARSCVSSLNPDIIILDEFQRFKHLLRENSEDDAVQLAQDLFAAPDARILLLSATPYKMYTLPGELDEDHYEDFLKTARFLLQDEEEVQALEEDLQAYRRDLYLLGADDASAGLARMEERVRALEGRLRRVMVRTERLAASADRNGMLRHVPAAARLTPEDVQGYTALQQVADALDQGDVLEYWKAAPYLLNFMEDYQLKGAFRHAVETRRRHPELTPALRAPHVLLDWEAVEHYHPVALANARMRALAADTLEAGAWQLLWLAPSLSYYQLGGPFAAPRPRDSTKRLVFSAWQVVPKAVAALLSLEAERRMAALAAHAGIEVPDTRSGRHSWPLLRFARQRGATRPTATSLAVLALLYPSPTLAQHGDPLRLAAQVGSGAAIPTLAALTAHVRRRLQGMLAPILAGAPSGGAADEDWYWVAPLLLDLRQDETATSQWFAARDLAWNWSGGDPQGDADQLTGGAAGPGERESAPANWVEVVAYARRIVDEARSCRSDAQYAALVRRLDLGRPPDDLLHVLAQLAVAGPGVAALRALVRSGGVVGGGTDGKPAAQRTLPFSDQTARDCGAQVAWAVRTLFNSPETAALVRGLDNREPYWRRVLDYCAAGGLQAVLDEYAHLLREEQGFGSQDVRHRIAQVAGAMAKVIALRTVSLYGDDVRVDGDRVRLDGSHSARVRFALRYGDQRTESDERAVLRPEQVRAAFNSPFWPFVLVTTSIGQEGLDFHPYCHAVVHWNLPANPVDLEQREGRVHRYKGHAVRKNVADRFGELVLLAGDTDGDLWETLFAYATQVRSTGANDLVPYWIFPGDAAIERHVPALPLSRDADRLEALRRALAVYRMVFGQPRQEDLAKLLLDRIPEERLPEVRERLRVDLAPPSSGVTRDGEAQKSAGAAPASPAIG